MKVLQSDNLVTKIPCSFANGKIMKPRFVSKARYKRAWAMAIFKKFNNLSVRSRLHSNTERLNSSFIPLKSCEENFVLSNTKKRIKCHIDSGWDKKELAQCVPITAGFQNATSINPNSRSNMNKIKQQARDEGTGNIGEQNSSSEISKLKMSRPLFNVFFS